MKGRCLCGQVEFEVFGKLPNLYQCHCSLCKKATGTSACASLITDINNVRWIKGQDGISSYTKDNGFRSDFCSVCGSPVPNKMNIGEYMWVPAGLLDGAIDSKIAAHIFTRSKASWEQATDHCKALAGGPEDIDEFMEQLRTG